MGDKIHAMFVNKDYQFIYYFEYELGKTIEKDYGNSYKLYDNDRKDDYQRVYERYWSSYTYYDGDEGYVFISKNARYLFDQIVSGNVSMKYKKK